MPLVFIHGVNSRLTPGYQEGVAARDALFRRFELAVLSTEPAAATIINPFWGGQGAAFRWGLACIPTADTPAEALGAAAADSPAGQLAAAVVAQATEAGSDVDADHVLLTAARSNFPVLLDLLMAGGAMEIGVDAVPGQEVPEAEPFADLAHRAAAYADRHQQPPTWVDEVDDDEAFLQRLQVELSAVTPAEPSPVEPSPAGPAPGEPAPVTPSAVEALGGLADVWGAFRDGVDRVRTAAGDALGSRAYDVVRRHLAPTVATFFGDVFEYLAHRGSVAAPGAIPTIVVDALRRADAARTDGDPHLVVIGHSLGGVIGYDVLTSFSPVVPVDFLVTVGSQVGLFEELKLFVASDPAVPGDGVRRVQPPASVQRWINVYDGNDLLSYRLAPLVDGVSEFRYATGELFTAHGAYFGQPRFHQRLMERLKEPVP